MQTITEALGVPLHFPEGYKPNVKIDNTKKYLGSPKFNELEIWLSAVTMHYVLMRFGGDTVEVDRLRVIMLLECLEGDVLKWYMAHVLGPRRQVAN